MEINPINAGKILSPGIAAPAAQSQGAVEQNASPSFKDLVKTALNEVNSMQTKADQSVQALAMGEPVDIHDVMMEMEKASMALQLTMQIRNQLLNAYQEISRMQF